MNKKQVTIDETDYLIDVEKAIANGCMEKKKKQSIGQIYIDSYGFYHILAIVGVKRAKRICNCLVALVNLHNGNRHTNPISVAHTEKISDQEWEKISHLDFKLVGEKLESVFRAY